MNVHTTYHVHPEPKYNIQLLRRHVLIFLLNQLSFSPFTTCLLPPSHLPLHFSSPPPLPFLLLSCHFLLFSLFPSLSLSLPPHPFIFYFTLIPLFIPFLFPAFLPIASLLPCLLSSLLISHLHLPPRHHFCCSAFFHLLFPFSSVSLIRRRIFLQTVCQCYCRCRRR